MPSYLIEPNHPVISCETGRREVMEEEKGRGGRREGGYVVNVPLSDAPGARDIRHADMEGAFLS